MAEPPRVWEVVNVNVQGGVDVQVQVNDAV